MKLAFFPQSVMSFILKEFKYAMKNEMAIKDGNAIPEYSDNMSLEDWARYIVHTKPMSQDDLVNADPNSNAPIFMEQKERLQKKDVSVHNAGIHTSSAKASDTQANTGSQQNVNSNPPAHLPPTPQPSATPNKSPQQTGTKKKVMCGFMIASPFLAVGVYTLVVGAAAFNPVTAAVIFIGVAVAALALFGAIELYEKFDKKREEKNDMGISTAIKETFLGLFTPGKSSADLVK